MQLSTANQEQHFAITSRDIVAVLFRQRRVLIVSFVLIFVASAWLLGALSPSYKAEMKLLVRRGRLDPIVTSQSNTPTQVVQEDITESELNSEVELLNSHELLRKVVLATGVTQQHSWRSIFGSPSETVQVARAVRDLKDRLKAEPLRKSNVIYVSLQSSDPEAASRILNSLATLYLEKHLQVHRSDGEFKFFDEERQRLRESLRTAEARLTDFTLEQGVVSAQLEQDLTLRKASELDGSLTQTLAGIAEAKRRVGILKQQATTLPPRITTQLRTADNPQLLQQMKSTLLQMELKRTELLSRFERSYLPVKELEIQIRDTKTAIAGEKNQPIRDETTDRNLTYQWVDSELAKAQTDVAGLEAKATADRLALSRYKRGARSLQQASLVQGDLLRGVKTQEDNYLLYLRKEEEARVNDALDRRGILNVAIADPPFVPALPSHSAWYYPFIGLFLAGVGSVALSYAVDFIDPSFRTPDEVVAFLDTPVLACTATR